MATASMPVIMLTAKAAKARENDAERGFELGADDYVIKPFSPREVARRAIAITSRRQSALLRQSLARIAVPEARELPVSRRVTTGRG